MNTQDNQHLHKQTSMLIVATGLVCFMMALVAMLALTMSDNEVDIATSVQTIIMLIISVIIILVGMILDKKDAFKQESNNSEEES